MAKKAEKSKSSVELVSTTQEQVVTGKEKLCVVSEEPATNGDVALEVQILDLEKALENAKNTIESAAADNERMADALENAVAENKSLRKDLSKYKQDYKKAQGDNRANAALVESLDGELTRQKVRNKELMDTIARMQDEQKRYVEKLSAVEDAYSSCNLSKSLLDKELANYRGMSLWNRIKFVFCGDKMFVGKK